MQTKGPAIKPGIPLLPHRTAPHRRLPLATHRRAPGAGSRPPTGSSTRWPGRRPRRGPGTAAAGAAGASPWLRCAAAAAAAASRRYHHGPPLRKLCTLCGCKGECNSAARPTEGAVRECRSLERGLARPAAQLQLRRSGVQQESKLFNGKSSFALAALPTQDADWSTAQHSRENPAAPFHLI